MLPISLDQVIEKVRVLDVLDEAAHVEADTVFHTMAAIHLPSDLQPVS